MAGVRSEDELGIKWDRCLADTGVKLLGGAVFLTTLIDIVCITYSLNTHRSHRWYRILLSSLQTENVAHNLWHG